MTAAHTGREERETMGCGRKIGPYDCCSSDGEYQGAAMTFEQHQKKGQEKCFTHVKAEKIAHRERER